MIKQMTMAMAALMLTTGVAAADTTEIRMLNKALDGTPFAFEPALVKLRPGDTVTFVPATKGHNVESIAGTAPDGTSAVAGGYGKEVSVTFDKPGVYAFRCAPHYGMGMVALVVVGDGPDVAAALDRAASLTYPGRARKMFDDLIAKARQ